MEGTLRPWQATLNDEVSTPANDRDVRVVVDKEGNSGKSWLVRWWLTNRPNTQFLSVGKKTDLAYAVDVSCDLFVFDIPRGSMEFFQWALVEDLKNRLLMSTKYQTQMKVLHSTPHVIIFTNEEPDRDKLSMDRWKIMHMERANGNWISAEEL